MKILWCALKNLLFIRLKKNYPHIVLLTELKTPNTVAFALTFLWYSSLEPSCRTSAWSDSLFLLSAPCASQGLSWALRTFPARNKENKVLRPDLMVDFRIAKNMWFRLRNKWRSPSQEDECEILWAVPVHVSLFLNELSQPVEDKVSSLVWLTLNKQQVSKRNSLLLLLLFFNQD